MNRFPRATPAVVVFAALAACGQSPGSDAHAPSLDAARDAAAVDALAADTLAADARDAAPAVDAPSPGDAAVARCTVTVADVAMAAHQAGTVAPGSVVCIRAGAYGQLTLDAAPASNVTVQAVPGDHVTLAGVQFTGDARNLTVHGFWITDTVGVAPGGAYIVIDHNDITGGGQGIDIGSVDCEAPNAPSYAGCTTTPAVTHITIRGNRLHDFGHGSTEDALHFNHYDTVLVTDNEITRAIETGNHTDALQSVWGGSNLTFTRNYEHDNQCQSFFLKDGDVTNATVTDNLFVRDQVGGIGESSLQVFNTHNLVIQGNTDWSGQGDVIRTDGSVVVPTATVDHNVLGALNTLNDSGPEYMMVEAWNIYGEAPWSFTPATTSTTVASPHFMNPAVDDYRLADNPNHIGVDWAPADQHYGP